MHNVMLIWDGRMFDGTFKSKYEVSWEKKFSPLLFSQHYCQALTERTVVYTCISLVIFKVGRKVLQSTSC